MKLWEKIKRFIASLLKPQPEVENGTFRDRQRFCEKIVKKNV